MSKKPSIKSQFDQLESIVAQLESGDLELETSLKLFQEGTQLAANLKHQLANFESTLKKISPPKAR